MNASGYIRENHSSMYCEREKRNFRRQMTHSNIHNVYELYYLFDGRVQYNIDGETYDLKAGSFVFISKETPHKTTAFTSHHERFLIMFNDDNLPVEALSEFKKIIIGRHLVLPTDKKYKFELILADIEKEKKINDKYSEKMIERYLYRLIVFIIRNHRSFYDESDKKIPPYIDEISEYISKNYAQDITLASIAKTVHMNESYMSRRFGELTGANISEHINSVRIREAIKLLTETDCSVTEVATKCGFNNENYFAAVFKKMLGTTPLKYKNENKDVDFYEI